jgi:hypothetical protein
VEYGNEIKGATPVFPGSSEIPRHRGYSILDGFTSSLALPYQIPITNPHEKRTDLPENFYGIDCHRVHLHGHFYPDLTGIDDILDATVEAKSSEVADCVHRCILHPIHTIGRPHFDIKPESILGIPVFS